MSETIRRTPSSTYRLQLHEGFTFDDAAAVADYLKALGISHVYSSPYLQAVSGSKHGYDVVDHQSLNRDLGGDDGHRRFCLHLKELGMGQVLDIVPNHMALGPQNLYWWDVLENGPSSRYAGWFDIDWHSTEVKLQNKVLIPVLGDQYGRILSARQIKLVHASDSFQIHYMDNLFPVAPISLYIVLSRAAQFAQNDLLSFIADSFSQLPSPESVDPEVAEARHRDKTVIYGLLNRLSHEEPQVNVAIDRVVDELNRDIDALDSFLNRQHYRLAYWRTADQELGYRRFFDINSLIGLRVERAYVFEATHRRVLEWLDQGVLDGVRVDHPDGLRDPQQYFDRLRRKAPNAWIIGEKILEPGETLRHDWPVEGTSGYDFLNVCNNLLMDGDGLKELTGIYSEFTQQSTDFESTAHDKKLNVQQEALGSDVNRLTSLFVEICESNRDRRDYTRAEIRRAIREVASCFSVYRTYVAPDRNQIEDEDRIQIDSAVNKAKEYRQDLDPGLLDFIGDVLALRVRGPLEAEFVLRFQQFTSPVMAKGVEDTAFYCFNRMIGLNEVGGAPAGNGMTIEEFHAYCARMQWSRPFTMTTLSTHDTKRSEDVRARLAVITETPSHWKTAIHRWSKMNASFRSQDYPDRNTEFYLYQTLVGAWPISKERILSHMEKATREAKQMTSWTQQNKEFEDALRRFIEEIFASEAFVSEVDRFVERIVNPGRFNSLAQTLLKFMAPGVPDTYQGCELWDLSLVDPDNRRPVDFTERRQLLAELTSGMDLEEISRRSDTGLPKLWIAHQALCLRRDHPEWFGAESAYSPIFAEGQKANHLIGFLRGDSVAVFIPRWPLKLAGKWGSTSVDLPPGTWANLLTRETVPGGEVRAQALFERFPVALLVREAA